jgi:hypothetical protein
MVTHTVDMKIEIGVKHSTLDAVRAVTSSPSNVRVSPYKATAATTNPTLARMTPAITKRSSSLQRPVELTREVVVAARVAAAVQ